MILKENALTFLTRQLIRGKYDTDINSNKNINRSNLKNYLKVFCVNQYPFIGKLQEKRKTWTNYKPTKISELKNKIDKLIHKKNVFAFDIFDTIIYRKIPPESIKDLTAKYLSNILDMDWRNLRHQRFQSEIDIGQEHLKEGLDSDNKHDEVMAHWLSKYIPEKSKRFLTILKKITDHEINIELQSIYTKKEIIDLLSTLKTNNKKIIFVSDMYFSSNIVFKLLKKLKINNYFNEGYTSSEYLLTKKSGKLFDKLIEDKIIDPEKTVFIGDNYKSDYLNPTQRGIISIYLYDNNQKYLNRRIERLDNLRKNNPFWEGAYLKEIIENNLEIKFNNYDYNLGIFICPIYIAFVEKIINYCTDNHINKIYFLAREGRTFLKIFNSINDNPNLDAKYLQASRRSTFLPSFKTCCWEELNRIWKQYSNQSPENIIRNLQLPYKSSIKIFKKYGLKSSDPISTEYKIKKLKALICDQEFVEIFQKVYENQKNNLIEYLENLYFFTEKKIAIVDIGWKGSIQDNISRTISDCKNIPEIHGLYFGYVKSYNTNEPKNIKKGLIVDSESSSWYEKIAFENGPLFEMSSTPNEGSTTTYKRIKNKVVPVTYQYKIEKNNYTRYFKYVQTGIDDYVNTYKKLKPLLGSNTSNLHHFFIDEIIRFIRYPSLEEANSFLRYSHIESFGVKQLSKFNFNHRWSYILQNKNPISIAKRIKDNFYNQFWISGIIKRTRIPLLTIIFDFQKNKQDDK